MVLMKKEFKELLILKKFTTKLIVQPNSNEFAPGGFSSIAQATANHTGENVIYNFDYYINQEQLDAAELQKDLYLTTNPYLGYYTKLNTFNRELRTIAEKIISNKCSISSRRIKY